ncbi:hypothetical protein ACFVJK_30370 [Streptomyces sp. NPDC127172]|uniref:hypothetical protein n=1 Tax=Streptomyces sp. NPDC127172 TaxID=3345382 RepID=UPI0036252F6D
MGITKPAPVPADDVAAAGKPPRYLTLGECETGRPLCGMTARLYPAGWRCDKHRPTAR